MQGSGFSEVIASLEAELRAVKLAHGEVAQDNRGCYNQIRAKDKALDAAAAQLEPAQAVLVENKASPGSLQSPARDLGFPWLRCHVSSQGAGCCSCAAGACP